MATRSNYSSLVNTLSGDGFSEYLGPDGIWYPYPGEGPPPDAGQAPIDRPMVDTGGMTQTPKVAGDYNGPALPPGGLPDYSAYEEWTGKMPSARRGPLEAAPMPGMSPFTTTAGPERARLTPGNADAAQADIRAITQQAGGGLDETVKEVGAERATASPRAMLQALGAQAPPGAVGGSEESRRRRRQFGAPVNLQALLNQL